MSGSTRDPEPPHDAQEPRGTISPGATAFPHRRALFDLQIQAYWGEAWQEAENVAWVNGFRQALTPYTTGAYVNYIDADQPDWPAANYGENLTRLMQVKARYDPDNVFNGPQSIPVDADND